MSRPKLLDLFCCEGGAGVGLPFVVENVMGAPMRVDYLLCGSMFGLRVRRHRQFQTSWGYGFAPSQCQHRADDFAFEHKNERAFADAMGCQWMTSKGGRQALPPAYTEFLGAQLMAEVLERAA